MCFKKKNIQEKADMRRASKLMKGISEDLKSIADTMSASNMPQECNELIEKALGLVNEIESVNYYEDNLSDIYDLIDEKRKNLYDNIIFYCTSEKVSDLKAELNKYISAITDVKGILVGNIKQDVFKRKYTAAFEDPAQRLVVKIHSKITNAEGELKAKLESKARIEKEYEECPPEREKELERDYTYIEQDIADKNGFIQRLKKTESKVNRLREKINDVTQETGSDNINSTLMQAIELVVSEANNNIFNLEAIENSLSQFENEYRRVYDPDSTQDKDEDIANQQSREKLQSLKKKNIEAKEKLNSNKKINTEEN